MTQSVLDDGDALQHYGVTLCAVSLAAQNPPENLEILVVSVPGLDLLIFRNQIFIISLLIFLKLSHGLAETPPWLDIYRGNQSRGKLHNTPLSLQANIPAEQGNFQHFSDSSSAATLEQLKVDTGTERV